VKRAWAFNTTWLRISGLAGLSLLGLGLAVKRPWSAAPPIERPPVSEAQMAAGRQVYLRTCFVCHQPEGRGVPGQIPPLAKSDYLLADPERAIRIVLGGQTGEIVVNRKTYSGVMVPLAFLSDAEVADVLTYVFNSFGNSGPVVTPAEVGRVRATLSGPAAGPGD
jgi:nitrite reductase (NO-forming)